MAKLLELSDVSASAALAHAVQTSIAAGELLVVPTDTVYGVGADPFSAVAVQRLLSAKGRTETMPPPILAANWEQVEKLCGEIPAAVRALGTAFWPGALTIVMETKAALGWNLDITGGTVAVRIPNLAQLRELLTLTGPLAVSSANLHGEPPATTAAAAMASLGAKCEYVLSNGATPGPTASTIVNAQTGQILRHGVIAAADINAVLEPYL